MLKRGKIKKGKNVEGINIIDFWAFLAGVRAVGWRMRAETLKEMFQHFVLVERPRVSLILRDLGLSSSGCLSAHLLQLHSPENSFFPSLSPSVCP